MKVIAWIWRIIMRVINKLGQIKTKIISGGGTSVTVDDVTIEDVANVLQIKDDGVDDTKVGDRVPQFYRRQGGSATDWSTAGTTTYTPTAVRVQGGCVTVSPAGLGTIYFPVAFSYPPIVIASSSDPNSRGVGIGTVTTEDASIVSAVGSNVYWLAIGPE